MEQVRAGALPKVDRRSAGGKERLHPPSSGKRSHENPFPRDDANERLDGLAEEHKVLPGGLSSCVGMEGPGGLVARPHPGNWPPAGRVSLVWC